MFQKVMSSLIKELNWPLLSRDYLWIVDNLMAIETFFYTSLLLLDSCKSVKEQKTVHYKGIKNALNPDGVSFLLVR